MKYKIKSKLTGWGILVLIIIIGIICSCSSDEIRPKLNGTFANNDIELVFNNGILTGKTKCNLQNGYYALSGNYIEINLKGTKIYCINEYNITYLRNTFNFELTKYRLILFGSDFEIILTKVK